MVKVKHSFKNLTQAPLLEKWVKEARQSVKGLACPYHPDQESVVKLRLVYGRADRQIDACCDEFRERIRQALVQGTPNA